MNYYNVTLGHIKEKKIGRRAFRRHPNLYVTIPNKSK